jgi:hypothetical protein
MSAEYDVARQQRLRRALETIADAYGFTGELRRERIASGGYIPTAIAMTANREIAHQHGLEVKFGKETIDEFPAARSPKPAQTVPGPPNPSRANGRRFRPRPSRSFRSMRRTSSPFGGAWFRVEAA